MLSQRPSVRRWVVLVAALLATALTARLGVWQLDRARQKLDLQARIEARADLPVLLGAELARDDVGAQAQHYRRIVLQGRWLADHTVYLDNRQMDARQGFFVVTPLLLPGGDAVLVQRGWSPRDFSDRSRLLPVPTDIGAVQLEGRIAPPPSKLLALAAVGDAAAANPGTAVVGTARDDGLLRHWLAPAVDVSKHHGYAFQWFALCGLIFGLTAWFQFIRPHRLARRP